MWLQRGSEELLGEGTSNNLLKQEANGGSENNNEAKKVKLNAGDNGVGGKPRPSKVVHIRNIPSDVSETEIVHLGIPFGRVSNVLVLKVENKNWHCLISTDDLMFWKLLHRGKIKHS